MLGLSLAHILILILVFAVFFRGKQLGQLPKSIGKAIRNFKESYNEIEVDAKDISDDSPRLKNKETAKKEKDN